MKLNQYFIFCLLFVTLLSFHSCGTDSSDDIVVVEEPEVVYSLDCCKFPPLDGCVGGGYFYVPNAFTPNFDGFNDNFCIYIGNGIKEVDAFKVFSPDGSLIVEKNNIPPNSNNNNNYCWDGKLSDDTIQDDIYSYEITITNIRNQTMVFDGLVCLRADNAEGNMTCVDLESNCTYGTNHNGQGRLDTTLPSYENCQ